MMSSATLPLNGGFRAISTTIDGRTKTRSAFPAHRRHAQRPQPTAVASMPFHPHRYYYEYS